MNEIQFVRSAEPATLVILQAIEEQYGFILPDDYKAHILHHNGGFPNRNIFLGEDGRRYIVNKFKPVGGGKGSFERGLESLSDQLHPDLVPFANDPGGDQFCLSLGPEDYGNVYYISHESYVPPAFLEDEELEAQPRDYGQGVYLLAPSFTAFLEGLVEAPKEA
ncbi:SMI1/KNR4 family protein [Hymenobacter weizhouensis]|uniref:SMI1/KNR4 family protein n=1 Tax=Hymenobacter sp. YIM 151500-1 TaxID=2987689 RepID=UPI002226A068|nr:SMI1/KNR4 family protein [Hymenobacter sp. YIM 151500-1]UYZ61406.1 SMI1/KNR4 family protein [Hymenobacter sp. YIM 151500-1]